MTQQDIEGREAQIRYMCPQLSEIEVQRAARFEPAEERRHIQHLNECYAKGMSLSAALKTAPAKPRLFREAARLSWASEPEFTSKLSEGGQLALRYWKNKGMPTLEDPDNNLLLTAFVWFSMACMIYHKELLALFR